ncbi:MAG: hypothetical protein AB7L09_03170 [Nitrospira sp.]
MTKPQKRRIYIVGGKDRNVPRWLSAAFDYEQFEQDSANTRTLEPSQTPHAVICLTSWIGHEHWYGARDLAERLGVPLINSPGGWSGAIKAASDVGAEWFIQDIERAKNSKTLDAQQVIEVEDFIDNAWRDAYEREYEARAHLEKRYAKTIQELERLRQEGEAAKRVIAEVRAAASKQRKALDAVQARNERVSEALASHINSLVGLFEASDLSHESMVAALNRVADVRTLAKEKLAVLRATMTVAESGPLAPVTPTASKVEADS